MSNEGTPMQKTEGLAKAAAMMAILAALATRRGGLAVNVNPPATKKERSTRGSENRVQGIPAPPATPKGGVGVAQGRGTAVERREAGGGRAPVNASGTQQ